MTIQQGILTGIVSLLLVACGSRDQAPNPIPQDLFVEVYVELLRSAPGDSSGSRSEKAARILRSHGVSPEEFRTAVEYYHTYPEKWKPILDEVVRRLEEEERPPDGVPNPGQTSGQLL